jgi:hypothetical protein
VVLSSSLNIYIRIDISRRSDFIAMRCFACFGARSDDKLERRNENTQSVPPPPPPESIQSVQRSSHMSIGASLPPPTIPEETSVDGMVDGISSPFAAINDLKNHKESPSLASRVGESLHGGISPANSGPLQGSQSRHSGTLKGLNQQLSSKMRRVINYHSSPLMPLQLDQDSGSASSLPKGSGLLQRTRIAANLDKGLGNSNLVQAPSAPLATSLQATMSSLVLLANTSGAGFDRPVGSTSRARPYRSNIRSINPPSKQSRPLDRVNESHLEGLTTPPSSQHRLSPEQYARLSKSSIQKQVNAALQDPESTTAELKYARSSLHPNLLASNKDKHRRASLRPHSDSNYETFRNQLSSIRSAIEVIKTPYAGGVAPFSEQSPPVDPKRASLVLRKLGRPTTFDRLSQENLQKLIQLQRIGTDGGDKPQKILAWGAPDGDE